jgi:hypothetical protein
MRNRYILLLCPFNDLLKWGWKELGETYENKFRVTQENHLSFVLSSDSSSYFFAYEKILRGTTGPGT